MLPRLRADQEPTKARWWAAMAFSQGKTVGALEQTVDEGREGGAFGQDENQSESQEQDHDRREPPFLADAQEAPEFPQDGNFSAHLRIVSRNLQAPQAAAANRWSRRF